MKKRIIKYASYELNNGAIYLFITVAGATTCYGDYQQLDGVNSLLGDIDKLLAGADHTTWAETADIAPGAASGFLQACDGDRQAEELYAGDIYAGIQ